MTDATAASKTRLRWRVLFGVFAGVSVILAAAYVAFLNFNFRALYRDLEPADAASIVAELGERGVTYRLAEGGRTISVPAREADAVRLALIGSEAPLKGLVGFELFDESDMGLTDFAQKIKFQRALQGELARTIAMVEGVAGARVHLSIPEQSYFRGAASTPKAAVTIIAKSGARFDDKTKIAGVQRLVAASVPGLEPQNVVVINDGGDIISGVEDAVRPAGAEALGALLEEERYFRSRALRALAAAFDGLEFDVLVSATARRISAADEPAEVDVGAVTFAATLARDYALSYSVITPTSLTATELSRAEIALKDAVDFRPDLGDRLDFRAPVVPEAVRTAAAAKARGMAEQGRIKADARMVPAVLALGALVLLIAVGAGLAFSAFSARRRLSLTPEAQDALAARLKLTFDAAAESDHGVA